MRLAAVDLGATSGRVMLGEVGPDSVRLSEVHRFPNGPVQLRQTLHWDILALYQETLTGLRLAGPLDGIGIDSWAVDYGLLDDTGALLGNPVHYRDSRTESAIETVHKTVPPHELYAINGLQTLPFNTLYQLAAEGSRLRSAETMLLIPDLLAYWLTGEIGAEHTNASTTGLYDTRRRDWAHDLAAQTGIPARLLPPLRSPGSVIGPTTDGTPVVAVGSHDTASAVAGVPATPGTRFAYLSSGTWSLIGVELDEPLLTEPARLAGFSNEAGIDGSIRLLRNIMGLWVLNESLRVWNWDLPAALAAAADAPAFGPVINIDAPDFLPPGDMPARIAAACRETGQPPPPDRAATVRCILESLAMSYRLAIRKLEDLTGTPIDVIHVVGGGARNDLLCSLTADACAIPVIAGPTEAAALGNTLVQAQALGHPFPDRWAIRALISRSETTRTYLPGPNSTDWDTAESRATDLGVWP